MRAKKRCNRVDDFFSIVENHINHIQRVYRECSVVYQTTNIAITPMAWLKVNSLTKCEAKKMVLQLSEEPFISFKLTSTLA
jgi:hypothetical protein